MKKIATTENKCFKVFNKFHYAIDSFNKESDNVFGHSSVLWQGNIVLIGGF